MLAGDTDLDELDVGSVSLSRNRLSLSAEKRLPVDLDAVDLKQRHGGVAADLGVVVHFP